MRIAIIAVALTAASTAAAIPAADDWRAGSIPLQATAAVREQPERLTFYCCGASGETSCTVSSPGPTGEACFCPGEEPAGYLCLPLPDSRHDLSPPVIPHPASGASAARHRRTGAF